MIVSLLAPRCDELNKTLRIAANGEKRPIQIASVTTTLRSVHVRTLVSYTAYITHLGYGLAYVLHYRTPPHNATFALKHKLSIARYWHNNVVLSLSLPATLIGQEKKRSLNILNVAQTTAVHIALDLTSPCHQHILIRTALAQPLWLELHYTL